MAKFTVSMGCDLEVEVEAHTEEEAEQLAYEKLAKLERKGLLSQKFVVDDVYAE